MVGVHGRTWRCRRQVRFCEMGKNDMVEGRMVEHQVKTTLRTSRVDFWPPALPWSNVKVARQGLQMAKKYGRPNGRWNQECSPNGG